tara:strand:+ start:218 stop:469 length:252 start_codon:yes stop_codon:yes gene_type:complete
MAKIDSYSTATPSLTDLLLGTDSDSANATKNFTVESLKDFIISSSVPALASSTGAAGQIAYDSTYIYVCVATDTWKRVAIATW